MICKISAIQEKNLSFKSLTCIILLNLTKSNRFNSVNTHETKKIKIDTFTYEVPEFLISKKIPENPSNNLIKKSLYFTRNLIQNRFFIPSNLPFPKSRILLENYFN